MGSGSPAHGHGERVVRDDRPPARRLLGAEGDDLVRVRVRVRVMVRVRVRGRGRDRVRVGAE